MYTQQSDYYPSQRQDFFTPDLRRMRRKKNILHRIAKRLNTVESWTHFREHRNLYNQAIKDAKANDEKKQAESLSKPENISQKKMVEIGKKNYKKRLCSQFLLPTYEY